MIIIGNPVNQLIKQLKSFFVISRKEHKIIKDVYPLAVDEMKSCFLNINNKYYHMDDDCCFNVLHNSQWAFFLYTMSKIINGIYNNGNLPSKIYNLLKVSSSMDLYYEVVMPKIWFFDHPVGAVIGRACFSDFFSFTQGCTVGNNKGRYPFISHHVSMLSNSKVLGNCNIGDHVIISANCYIVDTDIPPFSIVIGLSPNLIVKHITIEQYYSYIGQSFKRRE